MASRKQLKGIIVPIVTPVNEKGNADDDGLRRVVRHVLDGGVHGVFVLGGTGNFCSFSATERTNIIRVVVDEVRGRVPVLAGCMDSNTRLVVNNVQAAEQAGADALVVEPPFYFPPTEDEVLNHFSVVARATSLPIVTYNIPAANKVHMDLQMTLKLAEIPGIVGIKDSSCNFDHWQELATAFAGTDFALLQGHEHLATVSFLMGAHGAIISVANIVPKLSSQLWETAKAGNLEQALVLQAKLMQAYDIFRTGGPDQRNRQAWSVTVGSFFAGLQCALDLLGVCKSVITPPFRPPTPEAYQRVRKMLAGLEMLPTG